MSKKDIYVLTGVIIIGLAAGLYLYSRNTISIPSAKIIRGLEIKNYEQGVVWAEASKNVTRDRLSIEDYPFLKNDYLDYRPGNQGLIPLDAWLNPKNGLYLAVKESQYERSVPAFLIFNSDGSHKKEYRVPTDIAQKVQRVQWVGEKVLLYGLLKNTRDGGFHQYIFDPREKTPQFVALPAEKRADGAIYNISLSENKFVSSYCSDSGFSIGDGQAPCTETTIVILDTSIPSKEVFFKEKMEGVSAVCLGTKDNNLYIKQISYDKISKNSSTVTGLKHSRNYVTDYCRDGVDYYGVPYDFSSEKNKLTIIPLS